MKRPNSGFRAMGTSRVSRVKYIAAVASVALLAPTIVVVQPPLVGAIANADEVEGNGSRADLVIPWYGQTVAGVGVDVTSCIGMDDPLTPEYQEDYSASRFGVVSFKLGDGAPEGAEVDDYGTVTLTATSDQLGTLVEVPVVLTYDDGSTGEAAASFDVAKFSEYYDLRYSDTHIENPMLPSGVPLRFLTHDGTPRYGEAALESVELAEPVDGIVVHSNGSIVVQATYGQYGKTIEVPLNVTYVDKSAERINVALTID
ncbi:Rib/alpha-like domain-containing protein [Corynebacterium meridianum]|uniref:Long Rib domain-containing protein n=1 Tax=Corynebacterium meridianum TaxID=2765363 RepID=A0A934I662_9CORY|nr:Rib/alpha-like domain-containing protein [Corynebacterium meridianum]MBI8989984.1 hypothetical protein [Corynebacterium meridianum]